MVIHDKLGLLFEYLIFLDIQQHTMIEYINLTGIFYNTESFFSRLSFSNILADVSAYKRSPATGLLTGDVCMFLYSLRVLINYI